MQRVGVLLKDKALIQPVRFSSPPREQPLQSPQKLDILRSGSRNAGQQGRSGHKDAHQMRAVVEQCPGSEGQSGPEALRMFTSDRA